MATVIPFEERAVAHLRERLGAAEEANQDLIAFARGHSGAVASIHEAVLAAIEADSIEGLLHVVTQEWPLILGIDAVALVADRRRPGLPRRRQRRPDRRSEDPAPGRSSASTGSRCAPSSAAIRCSARPAT